MGLRIASPSALSPSLVLANSRNVESDCYGQMAAK